MGGLTVKASEAYNISRWTVKVWIDVLVAVVHVSLVSETFEIIVYNRPIAKSVFAEFVNYGS